MPVSDIDGSPLEFLRLLSEPVRWQLLTELARSDRRVGELCKLLDKPQSLVSYHLRELRDGGLVAARQSAADGRDTYYQADVGRCATLLSRCGLALHPALRLAPHHVDPPTLRRGRKPLVLFLCTGNSARSQMAEALLHHRSHGTIGARSAGSHPKPLHPHAVDVMAERGLDISGRPAKHLGRFTGQRFDWVVTLCDKVREVCPDFPGRPNASHWSMPDPALAAGDPQRSRRAFMQCADEIDRRVGLLIAQVDLEGRGEPERRRS
jgi:protein-tyrosine-phosphatase/DNA-binding transcriptional ArsR family regulator